jgi:hypothetical protein
MTDKELIELAAKAAGITDLQWESDGTIQNRMNRPTIPYECGNMNTAIDWNPLTNDGDALRLAVKLNIGVQSYALLEYSHSGVETVNKSIVIKEQHKVSDPYAATRRAIVRSAAEIGKEIK